MFVSLLLESEPLRAGAILFVTPPLRPAMWHIVCNCECLLKGRMRKNMVSLHYTPGQPSLRTWSLILGRTSVRVSWHVHLILPLIISGASLNVSLKNAVGCSLHGEPHSGCIECKCRGPRNAVVLSSTLESVIATPERQRWQLRLPGVVWYSQVYIMRDAWELTVSLWLWSPRPGPRLETCVRDDHIMTHRTFISWMSAGQTWHLSHQAPRSVCWGTCVHCTLGSWVYRENVASPWWMASGLHLHESGLPRHDKGLSNASLAVPACTSQKWWIGLQDEGLRAVPSFNTPGSADVVPD